MILNSLSFSTELAVQIILTLLDDADILTITSDERLLQKLALNLHTDIFEK